MGNQPEFAVDPEGLRPGLAFQTASGGSAPEEGGPASSGWNMFGKGADMWYSSYMNFGGSGGGGSGGGASAASENAIPNTNSTSINEMIGIARNSPGGTANFNDWSGSDENEKGQSGSGFTADDPIAMEEVTITGKKPQSNDDIEQIAIKGNVDRSAWDRAVHWGLMPYKPKTPDAIVISIPFMVTGISGLGISYNIGFVGKDLVHYYSFSTQLGTPDVSLGLGISWSYYLGSASPSAANFFGYGRGGGGTLGMFSGSYSQGLNSYNVDVIWNNYQINIGSPSLGGYYAPYIYTNGWIIHTFK